MADQPLQIRVDHDLRPAYYDQFHCLAADCRFTCCKGWKITFNKKDYLSLKRVDGSPELNENMKKTLRRLKKGPFSENFYGEFDLAGGCCPLQRTDGLCSLQLEKGHGALPLVCKIFPRVEQYARSSYLERSLSPACEGVLELLWNLPQGVDYVSDLLPKEQIRDGTLQTSSALSLRFQDIRSQCIDLLQDRRYPLPQRIFLMGLALRELADGQTDIDAWLAKAKAMENLPDISQILRWTEGLDSSLSMFLSNNIRVLFLSNNSQSDFASVPNELADALKVRFEPGTSRATASVIPYMAAQKRFAERFADHDFFLENLIVSLFFHLHLPDVTCAEDLWKSFVNFCNLYSFYRFMAVMSCREGASGDKNEMFRLMVCASRGLIHNGLRQAQLQNEFFQNESATLAHMAILLSG